MELGLELELELELELDPRHGLIPVDDSAGHLIERLLCGESARSGQEEA
jgi:hypothetical protein